MAPLKRQTRDSLRQVYELNVVSAAEAVRLAEAPLKQANGSVVLFSTVAVAQGFANHVAISAAKGGVEGLTRALAADLAPAARVNAVAPSLMRTKIAAPLTANDAMATSIAALHALPRLGEGSDAAALAAFLLGAESNWITGQVFAVDGGRSRVRSKG
jgi:NAD(P)-dependent dehydrogenase (short-subunit alcohol dehydrogenase family)